MLPQMRTTEMDGVDGLMRRPVRNKIVSSHVVDNYVVVCTLSWAAFLGVQTSETGPQTSAF